MFQRLYPVLTRGFLLAVAPSLFSQCHLAVHTQGKVKLYLIKMLCSLPNSSPHIWFSLFVFCGWAMASMQLNQSLLSSETIWVTFLHVVWYDKAAAGLARNVSRQRLERPLHLLVTRTCTQASTATVERERERESF